MSSLWPLSSSSCQTNSLTLQGSGKTLAFGLPILHAILAHRDQLAASSAAAPDQEAAESLQALIFAPTRELAMQVSQLHAHASPSCCQRAPAWPTCPGSRRITHISTCCVVTAHTAGLDAYQRGSLLQHGTI